MHSGFDKRYILKNDHLNDHSVADQIETFRFVSIFSWRITIFECLKFFFSFYLAYFDFFPKSFKIEYF